MWQPSPPSVVIFDHLEDAPPEQVRHLSRAARALRARHDWVYPPESWRHPYREDQAPVSGEIEVADVG